MRSASWALLVALLLASEGAAHGLQHQVEKGEAVIVAFTHEDGSPLAHADCEIRAADARSPLLRGRTDAHGRLAFVPDGDGPWICRAWTAEGHGTEFRIESAALAARQDPHQGFALARYGGLLFGVALIGLLFTGLRVWSARQRE